jgi:hypothetical protein
MKLWTIIVVGVIAAGITFGQWAVVMGSDAFAAYGPGNHKVFTYGFPFQIVECAPELPIHTPGWQVPFRFAGNVAVFLGVGLSVGWIIGRMSQRHS